MNNCLKSACFEENKLNGLMNKIINAIVACGNAIVNGFRFFFVVPFLPSYKVVFSMYQVIPGFPVNRSDSVHSFKKGNSQKAIKFYNDVVRSTESKKIVPSEVVLLKRKKVVATAQFGPINEIKKFNVEN